MMAAFSVFFIIFLILCSAKPGHAGFCTKPYSCESTCYRYSTYKTTCGIAECYKSRLEPYICTETCYEKECCDGFTGDDCKTPVCFGATDCPNGGKCMGPDACVCLPGFYGPKCQDCGLLPNVNNGQFRLHSTSGNAKTVAKLECSTGYLQHPDLGQQFELQCDSDGYWSPNDYNATCKLIDCGNPDQGILHGKYVTIHGTSFGNQAVLDCDPGYIGHGQASIQCLETGKWSDSPLDTCIQGNAIAIAAGSVCEPGQCADPYSFCDPITMTCRCKDGYQMSGAVCRGRKILGEACSPGECIDNTVCHPISSTCRCAQGFVSNGTQCVVDCGMPNRAIQNGSYVIDHDSSVGNLATLQCDLGYKPDSQAVIKCFGAGIWSDSPSASCVPERGISDSCSPGLCIDNAVCHPSTNTCRCAESYIQNGSICELSCPSSEFVSFGESCYLFGTTDLLYQAARNLCDTYDTDLLDCSLVQVDTVEELTFLKEFMINREIHPSLGYWNDLFQFTTNGNETWRTTGDPLVVSDWDQGQPNDRGGTIEQHCTVFARRNQYKWIDQECGNDVNHGTNRSPFAPVCEINYKHAN